MLAIPALVTAILVKFKDSKFTYIYYAIPVAYAIIRIVEVNRLIKRLEKQI